MGSEMCIRDRRESVDERIDLNDVIALRAGANHGNAASGQLFKTLDVILAGLRQIVEIMHLGNVFGPARHGLVNGLRDGKFSLIGRHIVVAFTIYVVSHTNRNFLKPGKHIKFSEHDRPLTWDA